MSDIDWKQVAQLLHMYIVGTMVAMAKTDQEAERAHDKAKKLWDDVITYSTIGDTEEGDDESSDPVRPSS